MCLGSDLLLSTVRKIHVRTPFVAPMLANLSLGLIVVNPRLRPSIQLDNSMTYRFTNVVCVFDGCICISILSC